MTLLGRLYMPADLLILALILEMYICHSWLLDTKCVCVCVFGGRSASWSAYMRK